MKPGDPGDRAARLAERRAKLSADQQALLEQRLRTRNQGTVTPGTAGTALVAIQPAAGPRPPFFCVHPAGGDVLCFQALAHHMGTDQPFYGLQSLGLGAGEEPLSSIEKMAARYRSEITAASAGPYHLGGWSLGGSVVFELARQLAAEGKDVALLAILDGTPGTWPESLTADPAEAGDGNGDADDNDARWLADIADYLEGLWGIHLGLPYETLRALPPEVQESRFLAALKSTPFQAAGTGPEALRRLLRVFKTNVRAFRRYRPLPYAGKITLLRPAAARAEADSSDPTLGWGALSPWPVEIETVPGDHISALAEPHVRTLAGRLRTCIDQAPGLTLGARTGETPRP